MFTRIVSLIAILAMLAATVAAQKPAPRAEQKPRPPAQQPKDKDDEIPGGDEAVRLGTDLVNLTFSAVDRNNRIIGDIRQEEVTVLEDGRPQQLFTFKRVTTLPINIAILMDLSCSQEYNVP